MFDNVSLFVDEDEEECLVLDKRSAETHSKLIAVLIILARAGEIVEPRIGVTCRVAVRPKRAAAILVAARPGYHLAVTEGTSAVLQHPPNGGGRYAPMTLHVKLHSEFACQNQRRIEVFVVHKRMEMKL